MYEYEVILVEKTYGRIRVKANGLEEAKELALHSVDVEWEDARDAEVMFAIKDGDRDGIIW
jgi:hypothetical protein